jgi:hypothetical protein
LKQLPACQHGKRARHDEHGEPARQKIRQLEGHGFHLPDWVALEINQSAPKANVSLPNRPDKNPANAASTSF